MPSSTSKVHSHITLVALLKAYFWVLFALKFSSHCTIFPVSSLTKRSHSHNTELPQLFLNFIYSPSEPITPATCSPRNCNPCTPLKSRDRNDRIAKGQSSRCLTYECVRKKSLGKDCLFESTTSFSFLSTCAIIFDKFSSRFLWLSVSIASQSWGSLAKCRHNDRQILYTSEKVVNYRPISLLISYNFMSPKRGKKSFWKASICMSVSSMMTSLFWTMLTLFWM